ncbi:glycosyltransferase 87 family protein [Granulicella sp. S190]|uniref:glycosyltransferase 87 family protein n=1 Tax=Granulicella sp. S190 TaxID=1747226 RepID=UPI00131C959A|nr:glycosyltransferase 87 family protein [Granulicella sp. S190]
MTGNQALIARTALSVLIGGISISVCSLSSLRRMTRRSFDRMVNFAFIASRLAAYVGIFFILHIPPRGDIPAFYWDEAKAVIAHKLPYRDFPSSYAPLHPYLDALAIKLWFSPLAIILLAICAEALVLRLWLYIGRDFLTEQETRSSALLYLTSIISLQFVTIDGQDNVIIALLLILALLLLRRSQIVASGAAVGLGVAAVKFLPLLYFPAFFVVVPRRWRWLLGASLVLVAIFGAAVAAHLPILQPLLFERTMRSAGNLPYLFEGITGIAVPSGVWDTLVLVIAIAIILLVASKARGANAVFRSRLLIFGSAALTLALLLFSKKSWPPYLMLTFFPICLLVRSWSRVRTLLFAIFGVSAVVCLSYWATVLGQFEAVTFHLELLALKPHSLILLITQLVLDTGYCWLLYLALREICRDQSAFSLETALPESV